MTRIRRVARPVAWSRPGAGDPVRVLIDIPCFGRPTRIHWWARTWRCLEPSCPTSSFPETCTIAEPRARLTVRACWWAVGQIRFEQASGRGSAANSAAVGGQSGATSNRCWKRWPTTIPDDDARFDSVTILGVDEHIWHHPRKRGPKTMTGIVDVSRDPQTGKTKARILELVPGRAGNAYRDWLKDRGADSADASKWRPWTRSTATRASSMINSRMPPQCWTPST